MRVVFPDHDRPTRAVFLPHCISKLNCRNTSTFMLYAKEILVSE